MNRISLLKKKITPIFRKANVRSASVYGSFVRDDYNEDSDIDLLIELAPKNSLLDLIGIKLEIEKKTKRKVDLNTFKGVNKRVKKYIVKDLISIYEERS